MLYSLIIAIAATYANDNVILMPASIKKPELTVEEWFQNLNQAKETKTKLHLYFQDFMGGQNCTVWKVAESEITSNSPTHFGKVSMVDDLLTVGPEPDSEIVGRAQGIVGYSDLHDTAVHMSLNIVFTEGKYNGSTITMMGRNTIYEKDRELSIVGGTGVFRMARGVAVTNTYSVDLATDYAVIEYTLFKLEILNDSRR
ncbi:hypothetical protein BUALT_Bualt06G0076400 [Buddleja alternifolia]|uniref:Dirigent protein n=1 Tax=Buddleja alternifolia TaxID=168488 RepID=A0AAV6XD23_9LAMI|nr:hypothetical protein BUALT_Bualt06G0076400 [Buddleja alternifolia]